MCVCVLCVFVCDILWESVGKGYISRIESSKHLLSSGYTQPWVKLLYWLCAIVATLMTHNNKENTKDG